jgi:hypothetical protein
MKLSRTKGVAELLAHGGTEEDVVTLTPEEPEDMVRRETSATLLQLWTNYSDGRSGTPITSYQ